MSNIAWKCLMCEWFSTSANLNGPIMHEMMNEGHKVEPFAKALNEWGKALMNNLEER